MKKLNLLFCLCLILGYSCVAFSQSIIPKGVVAMKGVEASLPDGELHILDSMIQGAQIIGIGESVHGSSRYRKLEHRISKYLIEKKGFRLLMIENGMIRSAGMTTWLKQCGPGDNMPVQLLYQPINEDREFFQWLCEFNRNHPADKVVYRGMDIWDRPWEWQQGLEAINKNLNLKQDDFLVATHSHCLFHAETSWANYSANVKEIRASKQINPADYNPCMKSLAQLKANLFNRIYHTASATKLRQLYQALEYVSSANGFQVDYNFAYSDSGKSFDGRDSAQGLNEFHIWNQEGRKKAIIIAHNSHIAKEFSPSSWWKAPSGSLNSGLSFLMKLMDPGSVRTIGLTGYEVTGVQGNFIKPTSVESLDLKLHNFGLDVAYVNPRSEFIRAQKRWWLHNENSLATYPDGVYMIPEDNYDAIFFVNQSFVGQGILPWYSVFLW